MSTSSVSAYAGSDCPPPPAAYGHVTLSSPQFAITAPMSPKVEVRHDGGWFKRHAIMVDVRGRSLHLL